MNSEWVVPRRLSETVSELVGTKFSLLDVFAATTGRHIVFLLVSRSAFWVAFCVFVEATILISAHRSPIFPLRNKNGRGYTLRTVIRYDDKTSSRYACPEALAVGIVGIELDRHAHPGPALAHSLTRYALRSFASICFVGSLCASFGYTLTTGRSALTDAKAWLGATTMTDDGVLMEREHRRYQMRLSR